MRLALAVLMHSTPVGRFVGRRARRGFSLLEIIVAIAIIAMISAAVTVSVVSYKKKADIDLTRSNAQTIRHGVKSWWVDHDSGSCPSVLTLVSDGALDRGKSIKADAWEQPWLIECKDNDVDVVSRGPDKLPGTEDDIRVPNG
jgi:prepilin-type N-terminal cleavage/methylation domain-containing protein